MRNVAFSMMMVALAMLQIAVVSTELRQSSTQTAAIAKVEQQTRQVLASNETASKTSAL